MANPVFPEGICPGDVRARAIELADRTSVAMKIPAYLMANLPWAANYPNRVVVVMDDPQGQARSVPLGGGVWHWLSEVDGSDLGVGNASAT